MIHKIHDGCVPKHIGRYNDAIDVGLSAQRSKRRNELSGLAATTADVGTTIHVAGGRKREMQRALAAILV